MNGNFQCNVVCDHDVRSNTSLLKYHSRPIWEAISNACTLNVNMNVMKNEVEEKNDL